MQCDASSASINWDKTTAFLCGNMLDNAPPPDTIPGTILGPKDKTRYLGVIISRDPDVAPWENALAKALTRLKAWSKRNLSIHNRALIVHTMILPTVDYVLSAAPAPTHALCLLEKRVTEFLWDGADGSKHHPMVYCATLARPHTSMVVSTAHWSSTLVIPEEWHCGHVHCTQHKTGHVH